MKRLAQEALLVGVSGVLLAFVANGLSRRGLNLQRNYSPGGALAAAKSLANTGGTNVASAAQLLQTQLSAEGLQLIDSNGVAQIFRSPEKDQGLFIFVDARDDEHYQEGHIPGAFQLDHYHPERYLAVVLPACQAAQKVVVYCKGGSCEDSEQTAIFLRDAGVARDRLFVYGGGFDEWITNHLPVELEDRNSGHVENSVPSSTGQSGK